MKPFLKWAGGKGRLVPRIEALLPVAATRFIEPFMGSGAVFMGMEKEFGSYILNDCNADLIALYRIVGQSGAEFVDQEVAPLFDGQHNNRETFNALRAEFNRLEHGSVRRAAIFIYLNRHCFNGLTRYNKSGLYNVPFGDQRRPLLPRNEIMAFCEKVRRAEIHMSDFRPVMAQAGQGDVVYCDPPYLPLSNTANFSKYAPEGFGKQDHQDLAKAARDAADRGAVVIISNHDVPECRDLYHGAEFCCFDVTRTISQNISKRDRAREILAVLRPPELGIGVAA